VVGDGVLVLTAGERRLRARLAALTLHAQGGTQTAPARAAFMAGFERQVDPEGQLPEAERRRRAEFARRAYFARLAYASAKARAKTGRGGAPGGQKAPRAREAGLGRRTPSSG
jgi:hypothetical protein